MPPSERITKNNVSSQNINKLNIVKDDNIIEECDQESAEETPF